MIIDGQYLQRRMIDTTDPAFEHVLIEALRSEILEVAHGCMYDTPIGVPDWIMTHMDTALTEATLSVFVEDITGQEPLLGGANAKTLLDFRYWAKEQLEKTRKQRIKEENWAKLHEKVSEEENVCTF